MPLVTGTSGSSVGECLGHSVALPSLPKARHPQTAEGWKFWKPLEGRGKLREGEPDRELGGCALQRGRNIHSEDTPGQECTVNVFRSPWSLSSGPLAKDEGGIGC